jgi:hypothetical protein
MQDTYSFPDMPHCNEVFKHLETKFPAIGILFIILMAFFMGVIKRYVKLIRIMNAMGNNHTYKICIGGNNFQRCWEYNSKYGTGLSHELWTNFQQSCSLCKRHKNENKSKRTNLRVQVSVLTILLLFNEAAFLAWQVPYLYSNSDHTLLSKSNAKWSNSSSYTSGKIRQSGSHRNYVTQHP